jgi:tripartite-type tricarboxylate transporter receptor subunit TctC
VPFPPGGLSDTVARLWADKMKPLVGPVFIENQGGGGGLVGAAAVARASPDGYTILLGSLGTQLLIPSASASASYDPAKELEPITILLVAPLALALDATLPVRTVAELVAFAKASPGKMSYGSSGAGSVSHLSGELFKSLTQATDIVHVPYKGAGQMINDVISGHIPMVMVSVTGHLLELHRAGKLRLLAVTTPARIVAAPDIPTAIEAGVAGMVAQNFNGLFVPTGTPKPIIDKLAQASRAALADIEFRNRLIAAGFEPYADSSPEAARRFVDDEIGRWAPLIEAMGPKLE